MASVFRKLSVVVARSERVVVANLTFRIDERRHLANGSKLLPELLTDSRVVSDWVAMVTGGFRVVSTYERTSARTVGFGGSSFWV